MKLQLTIPSTWGRMRDGGREIAIVPGHAQKPDLLLAWSPMRVLPDEQRTWIQMELRTDLPPAAEIKVTSDTTGQTKFGWPLRIVEATVHAAPGGPATEWRAVAFYAFFEHAATAMLRATTEARYRDNFVGARDIMIAAIPNWSGEVASLSDVWDVASTGSARPVAGSPFQVLQARVADSALSPDVARTRVAALDTELAANPTADAHTRRGVMLAKLGDHDAALAAYRNAVALDATHAPSNFVLGMELARRGDDRGAIAAWEAAAAKDPTDADALYNVGLAHYRLGELEPALAAWERALTQRPDDFWLLRKRLQALYALGRYDAVTAARGKVIDVWTASSDATVRMQDEFVFDQFAVPGATGLTVHAFETLRPRNPASYSILTFRVVDARHQTAPIEVAVETSDYAKERGVPFVISVLDDKRYQALGTSAQLPPYPELKTTVLKLVGDTLAARVAAPKAQA